MRRRGFLGALLALPFIRRFAPKSLYYDVTVLDAGVPVATKRYHMTTYIGGPIGVIEAINPNGTFDVRFGPRPCLRCPIPRAAGAETMSIGIPDISETAPGEWTLKFTHDDHEHGMRCLDSSPACNYTVNGAVEIQHPKEVLSRIYRTTIRLIEEGRLDCATGNVR